MTSTHRRILTLAVATFALSEIVPANPVDSEITIQAVLQVQGQLRNPQEDDPLKAANEEGQKILKMGYSTREQLIECIKEVKSAVKGSKPVPDLAIGALIGKNSAT